MGDTASFALRAVSLDDKYTLREGSVFMSGLQALVRLPIEQRLRDESAGLNTAGFISGYRGSPLGRYDLELWRAASHLKAHGIHFQPGVNEDLAATAVWGTQFVGAFPGARVDGVFGIWYGKGPGVDRSGDPLRHGNLAGSSRLGGALVLAGDDHTAKSSTTAHQTDYALMSSAIPILYPANVQDILEFGLHGLAMSRYSGCWAALKLVTDIVESASTVLVGLDRPLVRIPDPLPESPHIRSLDNPIRREARLHHLKLPAALEYARANDLNRVEVLGPPDAVPRLGILTAGKSYADTRQALAALGWNGTGREALRLLKVGMIWPLDPEIVTVFAAGLDTILVVEEKRPVLENQLKAILYDSPLANRPAIVGKFNQSSEWSRQRGESVLPGVNELTPTRIAQVIARLAGLEAPSPPTAQSRPASKAPVRTPHFCSGCPHGTSTQVPEDSRALAGIGCHGMASILHPAQTTTMSHMGGEGVLWVGQAPFTDERHVFANMGDGTYYHSGLLAIRQALAANVNITFKLLVNGFVSMTGGQPIEGKLSVTQIVQELLAEGVRRIVVVTDDPKQYERIELPGRTPVRHRRELEAAQLDLRAQSGVSVLIYDQACAAERRRLRKRGECEDPAKRIFINEAVCEGCGDCGTLSECLSIEPLETEFGRKRRINQSSCNKDFSCVDGFCPSFVSVHGGTPRASGAPGTGSANGTAQNPPVQDLPIPVLPALNEAFALLVTGIGGTGVITIGAVITMAAHLDGKAASSLDVTGLAQKYGAVMSHIRIAGKREQLFSPHLAEGEADLVLGSDLIVTAGDESLSRMRPGRTHAVVNADVVPTGDFTLNADWTADPAALRDRIAAATGNAARFVDAARIATALLGDSIAANLFLLGLAWQLGRLPLSLEAIGRAIELNGVAVEMNQAAFAWGRAYAVDADSIERICAPANVLRFIPGKGESLEDIVEHRAAYLADYQCADYASRYRALVERARQAERSAQGSGEFAKAVARYLFKLLAHKDEYEVARLYCREDFRTSLERTFQGPYTLRFHLGGGPFSRIDRATGKPRKTEVGPWIMAAFRLLAAMRSLRGSWLDPFRRSPERLLARELLENYESDLERALEALGAGGDYATAVEIASWPEQVRGYGHIREASAAGVKASRELLLERLASAPTGKTASA